MLARAAVRAAAYARPRAQSRRRPQLVRAQVVRAQRPLRHFASSTPPDDDANSSDGADDAPPEQEPADAAEETGAGGSPWKDLKDAKDRGTSKAAPKLTDEQKKALESQWQGYVDYMSHQRDKGWKT
mmetsp:Transcript_25646/g.76998  ORF Transcript_25646/g.76998 Transcript_25646/m.76998 type:complete len:127 (-) Transcript_25646:18-398(-)